MRAWVAGGGRLVVAMGLGLAAGCTAERIEGPALGATLDIQDGPRGGDPSFYWLSPIVPAPAPGGTLHDHARVTVEIVEVVSRRVAATFATGGGPAGPVVVEPGVPAYIARWNTRRCNVGLCQIPSNRAYRISVIVHPVGAPSFEAGYADAFVVASANEAGAIDRSRFVPVVNGASLSVRFRIEEGMIGAVRLTPVNPAITVGQSLQIAAAITNIDGQPLGRAPFFRSSNAAVAAVSATGLVTGVAPGTAYVHAMDGGRRDSTLVTVTAGGEVAPVPSAPFAGARVLQDNPASGCAVDPNAGHGYVMPLSWSSGVGPLPVVDYEVRVHHPTSGSTLLDGRVSQVGAVVSGCAQRVANADLDGWEFAVRAVYTDGSTGPWGTADFGFLTAGSTTAFTLDAPDFGSGKTQVSLSGTVDAVTSATVDLRATSLTPSGFGGPTSFVFYVGDGALQDAYYSAIGAPTSGLAFDNGIVRTWLQGRTWDPAPPVVPGVAKVRAAGVMWDGQHVVTASQPVTIVP